MSNFDEILEQYEGVDKAVANQKLEKFKIAEKGHKARIAFPLVKKDGNIAQKPVVHFNYNNQETGEWANFIAPVDKNSKAYKTAYIKCGEPQVSYLTPICVYATNSAGSIQSAPVDYKIVAMVLRGKRLSRIQGLRDVDTDFKNQDILVTCDEPKFQDYSFQPMSQCAFRKDKLKINRVRNGKKETVEIEVGIDQEALIEEALKFMENIESVVANKWTDEKILAFFSESNNNGFDDEQDEDNQDEGDNQQEEENYLDEEDDL